MSAPTFRKGGEAASEAAKSQGGGQFAKVHYFGIAKDGDTAVIRYITDSPDWIWVDQHASVPTKNKPKDHEGSWPESMPAVCRYDEAFKGTYEDCYIDDAKIENKWNRLCKPSVRVWAIACLREEVICSKEMHEADPETYPESKIGKRIGYTDATREIEEVDKDGKPTGNKKQELALVVVNMAPSNFFDGLQAIYSMSGEDGEPDTRTITDRDFQIKRSGLGKDSEYYHVGLKETPALRGATPAYEASERWEKYTKAVKEQNLDLATIVGEKASDEYYARFFDPNKEAPSRKKDGDAKSDERPDVPDSGNADVDEDKLAAMRERVRGSATAGSKAALADVD